MPVQWIFLRAQYISLGQLANYPMKYDLQNILNFGKISGECNDRVLGMFSLAM